MHHASYPITTRAGAGARGAGGGGGGTSHECMNHRCLYTIDQSVIAPRISSRSYFLILDRRIMVGYIYSSIEVTGLFTFLLFSDPPPSPPPDLILTPRRSRGPPTEDGRKCASTWAPVWTYPYGRRVSRWGVLTAVFRRTDPGSRGWWLRPKFVRRYSHSFA